MSTHALLYVGDKKLYRHYDGYPEVNERYLKRRLIHNDNEQLIQELLESGHWMMAEPNAYVHYIYEIDLQEKAIKGWMAKTLPTGSYHGKGTQVLKYKRRRH